LLAVLGEMPTEPVIAAFVGAPAAVHTTRILPSLFTGDLLHITRREGRRIVKIVALTVRRGKGAEAALLYADLTPPPPPRSERPAPAVFRPRGTGRPTKRERRLLERITRR